MGDAATFELHSEVTREPLVVCLIRAPRIAGEKKNTKIWDFLVLYTTDAVAGRYLCTLTYGKAMK